jgi:DNA-binding response OmpR family regulator
MADRQPLSGRRILVVEDEYFIADEVTRTLNQAGAEVMGPCPTTERATRMLEGEGYKLDAAVLDLHLGGKSSLGLIRSLRRQHVPVLLATGYDTAAIDPELQALPRCEKPINLTSLVTALEKMLG